MWGGSGLRVNVVPDVQYERTCTGAQRRRSAAGQAGGQDAEAICVTLFGVSYIAMVRRHLWFDFRTAASIVGDRGYHA
jgi:hypothetical protein